MNLNITNQAQDVPFSFMVQDLLTGNIEKSQAKYETYKKMNGIAAIDLPDIETAISLHFKKGSLVIEPGVNPDAAVVIRTSSENVMDLNAINIHWGLPSYFVDAGKQVLGLIFSVKVKIKGLLTHPILLTRLTIIMSVM